MRNLTVLLVVAFGMFSGCTERGSKEMASEESTSAEFRIALRKTPYETGDKIPSGDFIQLNQHRFPVTLGEAGRLVSVSDGVTLEVRWSNAQVVESGNPPQTNLHLSNFSWRLPNKLVSPYGQGWTFASWSAATDVVLKTYWDHFTTPLPVQEADDREKALCLQWRWQEAKQLRYSDFSLDTEKGTESQQLAPADAQPRR